MRRYRYLDLLTIGFVVVLLISNLVGPKICQIGPLRPSAAEFSRLPIFVATFLRRCTDTARRGGRSGWDFLRWLS